MVFSPYGITLLSNGKGDENQHVNVFSPYGITLLSNMHTVDIVASVVFSPYGITLLSNLNLKVNATTTFVFHRQ